MDVSAWLRGLGLERYAPAFRDNDIDAEILAELTADDLIGLGVTSIGHRRRLLAAIAALREAAPAPLPNEPAGIPVAERRQLTVMFCDLVGSTALSARLDPEELREVIGAYHAVVTEAVRRFDGFVAKYMGDGVLVYFGFPRAMKTMPSGRCAPASRWSGRRAASPPQSRWRCALASPPASSSLAISSVKALHRSRRWSARRRTSPLDCRLWPSPARW
jgi:class 3 adenylate cyclase